jgi:teichoic acid transport system permease protein
MMYVWTLGLGFILARICSKTPDLANLVPVFTSLLRFIAGVMYSLHTMMPKYVPHSIREILFNEPWALMLNLARSCCVKHCHAQPWEWGLGAGYAIVIVVIGFIYFWRDEARYGRD